MRVRVSVRVRVKVRVRVRVGVAGAHVAADGAKRDHDAARHVLAAVVARALDHRLRVGVAHAEARGDN